MTTEVGDKPKGRTDQETAARFWAKKLRQFAVLSDEDEEHLTQLAGTAKRFRARHDIITEGDKVEYAVLVCRGCLGRYKVLANGQRQILGFQLPGDVSDLDSLLFQTFDHSIATLVASEIAVIPRAPLLEALNARPALSFAFRSDMALDKAILQEWQVNVGRRSAHERLAHLLVEILHRLKAVDATWDHHISLPLTQTDIADTTSLSTVHVNRILQEWRSEGLIDIQNRMIHIKNEDAMLRLASFDKAYLNRVSGQG